MRYHKAVAIHKVEADFIAETSLSSRNENVVICHGEQWYDVRADDRKRARGVRRRPAARAARGIALRIDRAPLTSRAQRRAARGNNIGDLADSKAYCDLRASWVPNATAYRSWHGDQPFRPVRRCVLRCDRGLRHASDRGLHLDGLGKCASPRAEDHACAGLNRSAIETATLRRLEWRQ